MNQFNRLKTGMKKVITSYSNKQFNMKKLLTLIILSGIGIHAYANPVDSTYVKNLNTDTTKIRKVQRSLPSPLPDPPFPTSDWDGGPLIGSDGTAPIYPMQKALGWGTKSRFRFYGWWSAVNFRAFQ